MEYLNNLRLQQLIVKLNFKQIYELKPRSHSTVSAWHSNCSTAKAKLFENSNENAKIWKRCHLKAVRFQSESQQQTHLKTLHTPLLLGSWLQWHWKLRLAPFWHLLTKGFVLQRKLTTPFCSTTFAEAKWTPVAFIVYLFDNGAMPTGSIFNNNLRALVYHKQCSSCSTNLCFVIYQIGIAEEFAMHIYIRNTR